MSGGRPLAFFPRDAEERVHVERAELTSPAEIVQMVTDLVEAGLLLAPGLARLYGISEERAGEIIAERDSFVERLRDLEATRALRTAEIFDNA